MPTRLIERRIQLGWAKKEAAHYVGVSEQFIGQLERGKKQPSIKILGKICVAYECTADWIIGLPNAPTPNKTLSANEHSILAVMKQLPDIKKEEVIRLAEVVLETHRKEEREESEPSLFDRIQKKYESDDNTPRIIGNDSQDN